MSLLPKYAALLLGTLLCGGCTPTVQMFAGSSNQPHAVLMPSAAVRVMSVDDTYVENEDYAIGSDTRILIEPGVHRVSLHYSEFIPGKYFVKPAKVRSGINRQTLVYNFQAGKTYTFDARTTGADKGDTSIWLPELIDAESRKVLLVGEK